MSKKSILALRQLVLGLLLLVAGPSALAYDVSQIIDGLYLSDAVSARNPVVLKELGITHVLDVTDYGLTYNVTFVHSFNKTIVPVAYANPPEYIEHYKEFVTYLHIYMEDKPEFKIETHFTKSYEFISKALAGGGKVLVHCHMGISRSSTIVIAYLMKEFKKSYRQTAEFVKSYRPVIRPNRGFRQKLKMYQDEIEVDKDYKLELFISASERMTDAAKTLASLSEMKE